MALRATVKLHPQWEVCGEATDGREAVAKAEELQPDLIVLDFKMPVANGIKASCEISSSTPDIPILMCTLYRTPELEAATPSKHKTFDLGMQFDSHRPYQPSHLLTMI